MSAPESFRARLARLRREAAPADADSAQGNAAQRGTSQSDSLHPDASHAEPAEAARPAGQPSRLSASGPDGAQAVGESAAASAKHPPPIAPAARASMPAWLSAKLRAKGRSAATSSTEAPRESAAPKTSDWSDPHLSTRPAPRAGRPEPLERSACGGFAERIVHHGCQDPHGQWPLERALLAAPTILADLARDPTLVGLDPARALYLDIETTGLSGGAGTWPFLVALGQFERDEAGTWSFVLWQGFLEHPSEERALLVDVARRVAAAGALVTFFGKSFDRHRLEDKMRLHGIAPPFAGCLHLDLYHPLRRLYAKAMADGRLATMERELLGFARHNDLPGSQAPAAWFDYLAGRPHRLEEVFEHNRLDVLSLAALAAHLGCTLTECDPTGAPLTGPPITRARSLAHHYARARRWDEALLWCQRAMSRIDALPPERRAVGTMIYAELETLEAQAQAAQARAARRASRGKS